MNAKLRLKNSVDIAKTLPLGRQSLPFRRSFKYLDHVDRIPSGLIPCAVTNLNKKCKDHKKSYTFISHASIATEHHLLAASQSVTKKYRDRM